MFLLAASAAIVHLLGTIGYLRDTWLERNAPNRVSWFLWALSAGIAFVASLNQGATWSTLPVFLSSFGPALILIVSFRNKKSAWKISAFDWVCGAISVIGLILWQLTENANLAIAFALFSDLMASLPTVKKSWTHPRSETGWTYLSPVYSSLVGLYLATDWSFHEAAFPIYLVAINALIFCLVYSRKLFNRKALA